MFIHDLVGTKDRSTNLLMENGGYSPILRPYAMLPDRSSKESIALASASISLFPICLDQQSQPLTRLLF